MGQFLSMTLFVAFIFIGLIMYANYAGCDPLTIGSIENKEQLFPFYMKELFQDYPGFLGLLVAAMFSASISTVSSGINSQTAITHAELSKLFLKNSTPKRSMMFTKALSAVIGIIFLCIGFLATYIESIVDSVITWSGILLGPVLGVFALGMFSRGSNSAGALIGMMVSTTVGVWLKIGSTNYPRSPSVSPPLLTDRCTNFTVEDDTSGMSVTVGRVDEVQEIPVSLYQLSGVYYGSIAFFLTITVGMLVSMCTGPLDPDSLNDDLFVFPGKSISFNIEGPSKYIRSIQHQPGKPNVELTGVQKT